MKKARVRKSKKNSGQRSSRLKKIGKRLAAYSAAAAATVATTHDRSADAKQVIHDITPDITVGRYPGLLFNMVNGETAVAPGIYNNAKPGSMRLIGSYNFPVDYLHPYIYTPANSAMGAFVVEAGSIATRLDRCAVIGGDDDLTFYGNPAYPTTGYYAALLNWAVGDTGFAGFRFALEGSLHYGWAEITKISDIEVTLHSFGYNDVAGEDAFADPTPLETGDVNLDGKVDDQDLNIVLSGIADESICERGLNAVLDHWGETGIPIPEADAAGGVASVPEPSSLLLFAAGAAGLTMWRRRKRSGQAA